MEKYFNWHYGGEICQIPKIILDELNYCFDTVTVSRADGDANATYKQWFMQLSKTQTVHKNYYDEYDLTHIHWCDNDLLTNTKKFFSNYVTKIYRFRFSLLEKGHCVDYHSKHLLPRIHIPLNECEAQMVIKNDNGIENSILLEYGKAYYTNVTHSHKVVGDANSIRKNAFFSFTDFVDKNLKNVYCK